MTCFPGGNLLLPGRSRLAVCGMLLWTLTHIDPSHTQATEGSLRRKLPFQVQDRLDATSILCLRRRWLAAGRCCTSVDCQAFFGVGKGKAVAAALAAAEEEAAVAASLSAAKKKQKLASPAAQSPAAPSAKPWRAPLKPGEALLELGAGTEKYLDEFEHRELRAIAQYRHGTLVASQPFTVLNVRLDDDDGVLDWSFLVACKIDGGYH